MRWRQVIVLYAVLGGLAADWFLVERRPPAPADDRRPARPRFLDVSRDALREVRLTRGGRVIVGRQAGGAWSVVEPSDAAIPPDLVAAFTDALTGAEEIDRVAAGDADARAFGLDERAARVELVGAGGGPVIVTIGDTNPTGTAVYARRGGTPGVVLIGRNVRYYEDLLFQALPAGRVPAADGDLPIG